jgi:hypothetical protein
MLVNLARASKPDTTPAAMAKPTPELVKAQAAGRR